MEGESTVQVCSNGDEELFILKYIPLCPSLLLDHFEVKVAF